MADTNKVGTHVLYGKMGVCLVKEITRMSYGVGVGDEYYVLAPISDSRSSIYVPCANEELVARMCPLLSRDEIDALLTGDDVSEMTWVDDRNERGALYRSVTGGRDRRALIRLIRCLYRKKEERLAAGKHLSSMDEAALQECVRLVEEEFSMVLSIPRRDVERYVEDRIDNK